MNLFHALTLGLVEGLTEFIPVSSTGHLILATSLLEFPGEQWKFFTVFIQLGAISAVIFAFKEKLTTVLKGLGHSRASNKFVSNIIIAFLPSVFLGLIFYKFIKEVLFSPLTVAVALVAGGIIILVVERNRPLARFNSVEELSHLDSFKIGLAQCLAMCPGVSRSGATIIGGMFFGLSRPAATQFSFFLAIPTMFGATAYDTFRNWHLLNSDGWLILAAGFFTAFFAALITVRVFVSFVAKRSFAIFGWYRIFVGSLLLLFWHLGFFTYMPLWN